MTAPAAIASERRPFSRLLIALKKLYFPDPDHIGLDTLYLALNEVLRSELAFYHLFFNIDFHAQFISQPTIFDSLSNPDTNDIGHLEEGGNILFFDFPDFLYTGIHNTFLLIKDNTE
jgi:hypothetical protein